jgi:proteasome lid subunit RPN8/RPN11
MKPKTRLLPNRRRARYRQRSKRPPLRLTPYAWVKLLFVRDLGETEVVAFGRSSPHDLLLVEDVHLVRQQCTPVTVKFDDSSVADYFDTQVDQGRRPEQFARIWIHTHPGNSPHPSCTDEETFARCFGATDWALMFIVARGGQAYARLRFSAGPGSELMLPMEIDFEEPFPAADPGAWEAEYLQMVTYEHEPPFAPPFPEPAQSWPTGDESLVDYRGWPDGSGFGFNRERFECFDPDVPWELIDG